MDTTKENIIKLEKVNDELLKIVNNLISSNMKDKEGQQILFRLIMEKENMQKEHIRALIEIENLKNEIVNLEKALDLAQ